MDFADGSKLPVDLVVFATGVRPRDELAREAGPSGRRARRRGRRRGLRVSTGSTSAGDVYAIGEVPASRAAPGVSSAPGYTMAEIVADRLLGGSATFPGADTSTKLKLLGVDVASFGDAFADVARRARGCVRRPGGRRLQEARGLRRRADPARRRTRRRRQRLRLAAPDGRPASSAPTRPHGCSPRAPRPRPRRTCPMQPTSAPATTSAQARSAAPSPTRAAPTSPAVKACTKAGTVVRLVPAAGQEAASPPSSRSPVSPSATRCASTSSSPAPSSSTSCACRS